MNFYIIFFHKKKPKLKELSLKSLYVLNLNSNFILIRIFCYRIVTDLIQIKYIIKLLIGLFTVIEMLS